MVWVPPSDRVAELMRQGAEVVLNAPEGLLEAIDRASLAEVEAAVSSDPALVAAMSRTTRANLQHWARSVMADPRSPVPPSLNPEAMTIGRDMLRRGLDEMALATYRLGQNAAWQRWMQIAFALTNDLDELQELLDYSARSIFAFVDATIAAITEQMLNEREELTRGSHAERLEVVALLLDGAPIPRERAAAKLGYELAGPHVAAIVWSEDAEPDAHAFERAAAAFAQAAGARRAFSVMPSATALWAWAPGRTPPDPRALAAALAELPAGVRAAVGPVAADADGFRRSHLDAVATQRLMMRAAADLRVAAWDEVELVALVTTDEQRAYEFVRQTLGELEHAPAELRETVRVYLRERSSATRAAKRLYTHRNTVIGRIGRAEALLPRPLAENALRVALALEVVHWRGD